jgi:hypothetical protein
MNSALAVEARLGTITPQDSLQRKLCTLNRRRLTPGLPHADWVDEIQQQAHFALLEGRFLETERRAVAASCTGLPEHPDDFLTWFEGLAETGPGQHDPLFDWIATRASMDDLRWFLTQEIAAEAGFEDLVAHAQVRMPPAAKLEMARNYWDEMGRGREAGMHGPMLAATSSTLGLLPEVEATVWEALAVANLMAGLACNRRYAFHAIGALGAVELTTGSRARLIDKGLRRLEVAPRARSYFTLHGRVDAAHARAWNREVIRPLIAGNPRLRLPIAEGALMRLTAGARCYARYRAVLWGGRSEPPPTRRVSRLSPPPSSAPSPASPGAPSAARMPQDASRASPPQIKPSPMSVR